MAAGQRAPAQNDKSALRRVSVPGGVDTSRLPIRLFPKSLFCLTKLCTFRLRGRFGIFGAKGYSYPKPTGQKTLGIPMLFRLSAPKSSQKGYNYAIVPIIYHAIYTTFSSLLQAFFTIFLKRFWEVTTPPGVSFFDLHNSKV